MHRHRIDLNMEIKRTKIWFQNAEKHIQNYINNYFRKKYQIGTKDTLAKAAIMEPRAGSSIESIDDLLA